MINGLPFGESREQGVTRGQNFYHEPLGIALTAPPGWKIQNSPEAVVLVNAWATPRLWSRRCQRRREQTTRRSSATPSSRIRAASIAHLQWIVRRRISPARGRTRRVNRVPIELTIVTGPSDHLYAFLYAAKDGSRCSRHIARCRRPSLHSAR